MEASNLRALLEPSSIAIIGASNEPTKIGGRPIDYLKKYGYKGKIYPINPKYKEVQGIKSYSSLSDIDGSIDLAIVAVPGELVISTLHDCTKKQVKAAIVFSSGFAESGAEGRKIQEMMGQIASESGMRIVGPNCQGVGNLQVGSTALFSTSFIEGDACLGSSAIISQSGAVAAMIYNVQKEYGRGVKYWIATGNEADVNISQLIEYIVEDPEVDVLQVYLEDVKDGKTLIKAAKRASALNKPILVVKSGKTDEGKKAASSHTGALASEDILLDAIFKNYRMVRLDNVIELGAFSQMFELKKKPSGKKVAILSNSGGLGVMMIDECKAYGLEIATFSEDTVKKLAEVLPVFAAIENPIDVTAQLLNDKRLLSKTLPILKEDPNVDYIIIALGTIGRGYDIPQIIEDLAKAQKESQAIVAVAWVGSQKGVIDQFSKKDVPVFEDPTLSIKAIAKFSEYHIDMQKEWNDEKGSGKNGVEGQPAAHGFLSEYESKLLLKKYDLPITAEALCRTEQEACESAAKIGFPVALKISSSHIQHKTEIGGVVLNIENQEQLKEAFRQLLDKGQRHTKAENIEGILVQQMIKGQGFEISVGLKRDPVFGPAIMVASGGIYIEVLKDFQLLIPPVSYQKARKAIDSLIMAPLLMGVRGKAPLDIDALCNMIVTFSHFVMEEQRVKEVDLNPVIVLEEGKGIKIVDALIKMSDETGKIQ